MSAGVFQTIVLSQYHAAKMAIDPPRFHEVKVDSFERFPAGDTDRYYDRYVLEKPENLPERLIIKGSIPSTGQNWLLGIDLHHEVIACYHNWNALIGDEYMGSAALGIVLFGSPGLAVSSPVIAAAHAGYAVQRSLTGMDRHTWVLYRKLAPQLSKDAGTVLKRAFLNRFNGVEKAYVSKIAEEEAKKYHEKLRSIPFSERKDDISNGTFMVRYAAGLAEQEEIYDDIYDWQHRSPRDRHVQVNDWLGMSKDEYHRWVESKVTLDGIIEERERLVG